MLVKVKRSEIKKFRKERHERTKERFRKEGRKEKFPEISAEQLESDEIDTTEVREYVTEISENVDPIVKCEEFTNQLGHAIHMVDIDGNPMDIYLTYPEDYKKLEYEGTDLVVTMSDGKVHRLDPFNWAETIILDSDINNKEDFNANLLFNTGRVSDTINFLSPKYRKSVGAEQ